MLPEDRPQKKTSKNASKFEAKTRKLLGERIRLIWEKSNLTQAEFSDSLGISSVSLSNYMKGERVPDAIFICLLGDKHNVCLEWLLTGNEPVRRGQTTSSVNASYELEKKIAVLEGRLEEKQAMIDRLLDLSKGGTEGRNVAPTAPGAHFSGQSSKEW